MGQGRVRWAMTTPEQPESQSESPGTSPEQGEVPGEKNVVADRAFTIGLGLYLAVIGCGLLLRSLPEAFAAWLIDNVYDGQFRLVAVGMAIFGAALLAIGVVGSIGRDRLEQWFQFVKSLGPAGVLGVLWTTMPAIGGILLLTYIGSISDFLAAHGVLGLLLYIVIFIFSAGFGALPTYSQAILAGWAFGPVTGFLAAWVGFIGASLIGFYVARLVSRDRVEHVIEKNAKAEAIRQALVGHGFVRTTVIVTLLRIPPNSPFALTNLVMSATGVAKIPFLIGTALGMAPRTLAAVWLASEGAKRGDDILAVLSKDWRAAVIGIAIMFVVLGVIGSIAKKALAKVTEAQPKPVDATEPDQGS